MSFPHNSIQNQTHTQERLTPFALPKQGVFLSNMVKADEAKYITFLAGILASRSVKDAYILMNRQNDCQRLKAFPNIAFGRGKKEIWFATCDDKGNLLSINPIAAIFFSEDTPDSVN